MILIHRFLELLGAATLGFLFVAFMAIWWGAGTFIQHDDWDD
jgi:hypothetical protein